MTLGLALPPTGLQVDADVFMSSGFTATGGSIDDPVLDLTEQYIVRAQLTLW